MAGTPIAAPKEIRARWYLQVDKHKKTVTEVCGIFGISRETYYNRLCIVRISDRNEIITSPIREVYMDDIRVLPTEGGMSN